MQYIIQYLGNCMVGSYTEDASKLQSYEGTTMGVYMEVGIYSGQYSTREGRRISYVSGVLRLMGPFIYLNIMNTHRLMEITFECVLECNPNHMN